MEININGSKTVRSLQEKMKSLHIHCAPQKFAVLFRTSEGKAKIPERGARGAEGRLMEGCLYCYDEIVMSSVR